NIEKRSRGLGFHRISGFPYLQGYSRCGLKIPLEQHDGSNVLEISSFSSLEFQTYARSRSAIMPTESQGSSSLRYRVSRKVMNLKDFDEEYHRINNKKPSFLTNHLRKKCKSVRCTTSFWSYVFPFYHNIASYYTWRLLASDIFAGLTVSSLHVPQGMAYGYLAGLKPVNGLYTSFFPALIYFFFGTSRHISIGTFSVVSLLVAEPVDRMAQTFLCNNQSEASFQEQLDAYRLRVSVTVTMLAGLMQVSNFQEYCAR
ncbi:hypothetical protein AHF37_10437, partial [Paragonimus kellicotti]